jgi:hypothetical protein
MNELAFPTIDYSDRPPEHYEAVTKELRLSHNVECGDGLSAARGIGFGIMISVLLWAAIGIGIKLLLAP